MCPFRSSSAAALLTVLIVSAAAAQQEPIRPGWNLFSKDQDIQLGREAAAEIEKEVQVADDARLTAYVADIGQRLASVSQDPSFPFTFKVVADPNINAFALPGGPIYINSGLIAAADNEAQVAGVMAHEIGHVVLRHSTNQASKRSLFQLPAVLAAGALGDGGLLASLGNIGLGFGLNSVFMKYSRSAERDSDIVGARMMAASGYSPIEMARFFQKLEEAGAGRGPQFLASHPNPGNRVEYVTEEIASYRRGDYVTTSRAFPAMKERAAAIQPSAVAEEPPSQPQSPPPATQSAAAGETATPSGTTSGPGYSILHPSGWSSYAGPDGTTFTILPPDGATTSADGRTAIRRGILSGYFDAPGNLARSTQSFLADLRASNSRLVPVPGQRKSFEADGAPAESNFLEGPSTAVRGERENVWVVTARRPQGLFYLVMISPVQEYDQLYPGFERAVTSIRFSSPKEPASRPQQTGIYTGQGYRFPYPPGWSVVENEQTGGARIIPANGMFTDTDGSTAIVRGMLAGSFASEQDLAAATSGLLQGMQSSNPDLHLVRGQRRAITLDGAPGESLFLQGPSKLDGQMEYVWLVTALHSGRLFYLAMIAPDGEYDSLYPHFERAVTRIGFE